MLEVADLEVTIDGRLVVRIDRLTCGRGEILGLVGESGSGKTMTATAILGLAGRLGALTSGSIEVGGTQIIGASERLLCREVRGRKVAMIFQEPLSAFSPVMRVGELFVKTLQLHGESSRRRARRRAVEAVEDLVVPASALDRYPHELSGGQLQRVAIAIALALDVGLLLADEPTSALDVTIQAEILDVLVKLRSERLLAVLLISHDLAVIAETADRVAVMRAGSLVESGPVREVMTAPADAYTRSLIDAVPSLPSRDHR